MDDLRYAEEITPATFRQRSWMPRLMERGTNFIMRLL
jgi:hypothetical protein